MNFEIMNILPIVITLVFIVGCIILFNQYLEKKNKKYEKYYEKYLDSIKVGDTFELSFVKDLPEDPFDSNSLNHTEYQCVITDIKKNTKGETWVKYKNLADGEEKTEEIYTFAEHRNQI